MALNDWTLFAKKVAVGVIVMIVPLVILGGALWVSEIILRAR